MEIWMQEALSLSLTESGGLSIRVVQDYNSLEQAGFDLWGQCQDCQRWTLLTKGNHGHGTLTVDDARFIVDATAPIIDFKTGPSPEATVDMTPGLHGSSEKCKKKIY